MLFDSVSQPAPGLNEADNSCLPPNLSFQEVPRAIEPIQEHWAPSCTGTARVPAGTPRFYARRVAGRHHHHRHPDCLAVARGAGGARGGQADAVPEQRQATGAGLFEPRERLQAVPQRRLGLCLDRRRRPGKRPPPAGRMDLQHFAVHRAARHARPGRGTLWNDPNKLAANLERLSVPLPVLYCPTRRKAIAYPWSQGWHPANVPTTPPSLHAATTPATGAIRIPILRTDWNNPWTSTR